MNFVDSIIHMLDAARAEDPRLLAGLAVGEPPITTRSVMDLMAAERVGDLREMVRHVEFRIAANRKQIEECLRKPMHWGQYSRCYVGRSPWDGRRNQLRTQAKRGKR